MVSIPQAVSAVATGNVFADYVGCRDVSIPQAVSAVATLLAVSSLLSLLSCFNTASGKCCCNKRNALNAHKNAAVSIPQAVSAVATGFSINFGSWD